MVANQYLNEFGLSSEDMRERGLVAVEEVELLDVAEVGIDGREHLLTPIAAKQWRLMKQAALSAGESIYIVSGFRDISRQAMIIKAKIKAGQSTEDIFSVFAPPGYSEHHSGCAVDITTPGILERNIKFENTSAFQWLQCNAEQFGYRLSYPRGNARGFGFEPWHWCFAGT